MLPALRDHVIASIVAGSAAPGMGHKPKIWTAIDRDYENPRTWHADSVPARRHRNAHGSRIDNILSIG